MFSEICVYCQNKCTGKYGTLKNQSDHYQNEIILMEEKERNVMADCLEKFSMDVIRLIQEYFGMKYDPWFSMRMYIAPNHLSLYVAKRKIKEMKPGLICEKCVEEKHDTGYLGRTDISPICSECKRFPTYQDFQQMIWIEFTLARHFMNFVPHFREKGNLIYQIKAEKIEAYHHHALSNRTAGLSDEMWICQSCWSQTLKNPLLDIECGQCGKMYPRLNIEHEASDFCCTRLKLNGSMKIPHFNTTACGGEQLHLDESMSLGEALKLLNDKLVCDVCLNQLIKEGKLIKKIQALSSC